MQAALLRHTTSEWFESFADLRSRVFGSTRAVTVVVMMNDAAGENSAALAAAIRHTRSTIVVCHSDSDSPFLTELARAGVQDVLLGDLSDHSTLIRAVILGAAIGAAADLVLDELAEAIPRPLFGFTEAAIRRPRTMQRVSDIADALRIPRQTLSRWCRDRDYLRPEELLQWSRIFLIAGLFQTTGWSAEAVANAMSYASATALRNRIRAHTGLTTTDLRARGLAAVREKFEARVEAVKRGEMVERQCLVSSV